MFMAPVNQSFVISSNETLLGERYKSIAHENGDQCQSEYINQCGKYLRELSESKVRSDHQVNNYDESSKAEYSY